MMGGSGVLPDLETCGDGETLSFDKALFNWLVRSCTEDRLGVRGDEKLACKVLLVAVRNALQAIDGREGQFQYSLVPEGFKAYKIGQGAIKRAKKPTGRMESNIVRGYAEKLRAAIDRHAFTRSALWKEFVGNCEELHHVLMLKYDRMRAAATAQAGRQANATVNSGKIDPVTIEPCVAGTIARYESLERVLLDSDCYEIFELTEEKIASFHPPSGTALAPGHEDTLRKHFQVYRDNIMFHNLAVKKFPATFGSNKKMMLFLWKVRAPPHTLPRTPFAPHMPLVGAPVEGRGLQATGKACAMRAHD